MPLYRLSQPRPTVDLPSSFLSQTRSSFQSSSSVSWHSKYSRRLNFSIPRSNARGCVRGQQVGGLFSSYISDIATCLYHAVMSRYLMRARENWEKRTVAEGSATRQR